MKIIFGTPFLVHSGVVAVADTHIGVELHFKKSGFAVQSETIRHAEQAVRIGKEYRARTLVHLGDVKHTIGRCTIRERQQVEKFFKILSSWFDELVVIKGNHDGNIVLPKSINVCKSFAHKGVGFMHGHCYPEPTIANCRTIVCGHIHPCIMFRDGLGKVRTYKSWLIANVNKKFREKFGVREARKLFVMPSASDLVGMRNINDVHMKGFLVSWEYMSRKKSEFYLFDGTFLGNMENLERVDRNAEYS